MGRAHRVGGGGPRHGEAAPAAAALAGTELDAFHAPSRGRAAPPRARRPRHGVDERGHGRLDHGREPDAELQGCGADARIQENARARSCGALRGGGPPSVEVPPDLRLPARVHREHRAFGVPDDPCRDRSGEHLLAIHAGVGPHDDQVDTARPGELDDRDLGLPRDLEITNSKDLAMLELWDDRCVQLIPNTGRRADGGEG